MIEIKAETLILAAMHLRDTVQLEQHLKDIES